MQEKPNRRDSNPKDPFGKARKAPKIIILPNREFMGEMHGGAT
jgi:hypothetical protein